MREVNVVGRVISLNLSHHPPQVTPGPLGNGLVSAKHRVSCSGAGATLAWLLPPGPFPYSYCQGLGMVAAFALLMMEEEETFWLVQAILQSRRSDDYYGATLLGAMADQHVLE